MHQMLRARIAGVPQIKYATVIGKDGVLRFSSFSNPAAPVPLGDRSYVAVHRDRPGRTLAISEPLRSRTSNEWLIFVSRRLEAKDGRFAGVVAVALDPTYFEEVYKVASQTPGTGIGLMRRDGIMLARYPRVEALIGASFADSPVFRDPAVLDAGGVTRASR